MSPTFDSLVKFGITKTCFNLLIFLMTRCCGLVIGLVETISEVTLYRLMGYIGPPDPNPSLFIR